MHIYTLPNVKELSKADVVKQYRTGILSAEKMVKRDVFKLFKDKDYKPIEMKQHFRNAYGKLAQGNRRYFFKIASTPDLTHAIVNEVEFIKQAANQFKEHSQKFSLPNIIESGSWKKRGYYICDFCYGSPLADCKVGATRNLGNWIEDLADISITFLKLKNLKLPLDAKLKNKKNLGEIYWKDVVRCYEMARIQKYQNLDHLLEISHNIRDIYQTAPAHGDYSPWHVLKNSKDSNLLIVDTEFASNFYGLYYDIAHLYQRVYTSTGRRDVVREYARQFRNRLKPDQFSQFDTFFRSLLAFRTLACYVEFVVAKLPEVQIEFYRKLTRDIVNGDLY